MSKFCRNCGTELADEAAFCKNCGTSTVAAPVAAAPVETEIEAQTCDCAECNVGCEQVASEQKVPGFVGAINGFITKLKNKDKNTCLIAGGIAVALVVLLVFAIVFGGAGPEAAVENYFEVVCEGDGDAIEDLAPESFWEYLVDHDEDFDLDEFADEYEEQHEKAQKTLKKTLGEAPSYSYKIISEDEVSQDDLDDIKDYLKKNYKIPKKDVTDAVEFEVKITTEIKGEKQHNEQVIFAVKIDGDWYPCAKNGKLLVDSIV